MPALLLLYLALLFPGQTCCEPVLPEGAFPISYRHHLYIGGLADTVQGNFVFDTGASNLYYDSTWFAGHPFPYKNFLNGLLPGAGSRPQLVRVITDSAEFIFGDQHYRTNLIPVLQLKPILGDYADGILGMEHFYGTVLEISYEKGFMRVLPSADSIAGAGFTRINLKRRDNRLFIPLTIMINDTVQFSGDFLLDLGSGGTVTLTSTAARSQQLAQSVPRSIAYYTRYGGVGGASFSNDFRAGSLTIGPWEIDSVLMDYSSDTGGALASDKHYGLLGNGICERFHLCIDFVNDVLYLKPNESFNDPFPCSRTGFSWVDREQTLGAWIVSGLYKGSDAEKRGLRIDDRILALNGTPVSELPWEKQQTMLDGLQEIRLLIERGRKQKELLIRLDSQQL